MMRRERRKRRERNGGQGGKEENVGEWNAGGSNVKVWNEVGVTMYN